MNTTFEFVSNEKLQQSIRNIRQQQKEKKKKKVFFILFTRRNMSRKSRDTFKPKTTQKIRSN